MQMTFPIPVDAAWYRGSGQAVVAIENGVVVDGIYSGIEVELRDRAALAAKHPNARIVAGMASTFELTVFDPAELKNDAR